MPSPKDYDELWRDVRNGLAQLRAFMRNPFANTSLSAPAPGVLNVDGILQGSGFDGDLDTNDVGTTGWAMSGSKVALPEVLLRPGSIGNEILTSPSAPQAIYTSAQGFSLSATLTNVLTSTVPVPSGFTKAAVTLTARAYAVNPNTTGGNNGAGGDYLYSQANINGFNGYSLPTGVSGGNGAGTNVSTYALVLSDLAAGSSITLQCAAQTGLLSWAANATNTADLSATIVWYR